MPWLQAAAAVVLFAAGMAVSQLDVDYQDGMLTVEQPARPRCRRQTSAMRRSTLHAERVEQSGACARSRDAMLRGPSRVGQTRRPIDTEHLLQRVRAMIDQSEQRQQRELALRLSQVAREVDTQHQADLLRSSRTSGSSRKRRWNIS